MITSVADFVRYFDGVRRRTWTAVDRIPPALAGTVADLEGSPVRVWRFLMAMVEHEVHHRSQLDAWLALAGTEPPQVFGYRMEDVVARARRPT